MTRRKRVRERIRRNKAWRAKPQLRIRWVYGNSNALWFFGEHGLFGVPLFGISNTLPLWSARVLCP